MKSPATDDLLSETPRRCPNELELRQPGPLLAPESPVRRGAQGIPHTELDGGVYRSLVEFLPDGILIHVDGKIRFANPAAARILGADAPRQLVGRTVLDFVHPDDRLDIAARIRRIHGGAELGEPREERLVRLDGRPIQVEVRAMPIVFAGVAALQVIVRDITEQKRETTDRRRAEDDVRRYARDLEAWKKRSDAIVRASGQGLYSWDIRRDRISWSGNLEGVGGHRALPADLSAAMDLVHPDDRSRVDAEVRRVLVTGERLHVIYRLRRADGSYRFVEDSAYVIRDDRGNPCEMIGFIVDVNARQLAEAELRRNRGQLAEAQAIAHLGSWEVSADSARIQWSDEAARIFGMPSDPPPALDVLSDRVHLEDRARLVEYVASAMADDTSREQEFRIVRPDGEVRAVSVRIRRSDEPDSQVRIFGTVQDITERRMAEQFLRDSEERFRQLTNNITDVFWIANSDLTEYVYFSPAFEHVWGISAGMAQREPRSCLDVVVPEDRQTVIADLRKARAGEPVYMEFRIRRADGQIRWLWIRTFPIRDAAGEIYRTAGLTTDITDRRVMEEELRRTRDAALEADRLKTVFLANMSHEIRTPLNTILGLNTFIADHLFELGDHSQDPYFDGIQRSSRRLLDTIQRILDLSRIEAKDFVLDRKPINLSALIRDRVAEFEPIARDKGIQLLCRIDIDAIVVFDEYCLSQAVANLLDNALKFTEAGQVTVAVLRSTDARLMLEVGDTGVGISASYLPHIFDRFSQEESGYTRRFEGSGLGLALVRKYVEMNGASITVESEKDKGAVFRIHFTSLAPDTEKHLIGAAAHQPTRQKHTVLLVEDDQVTQFFMGMLLGPDCSVLVASSADECREQLTAHASDIELILMDLSLRGVEDGVTLTRALRRERRWSDIPIIAVTAHAFLQDREASLEAGCDDYVAKPVDRKELLQKMGKLLGGGRARAQAR